MECLTCVEVFLEIWLLDPAARFLLVRWEPPHASTSVQQPLDLVQTLQHALTCCRKIELGSKGMGTLNGEGSNFIS